MNNFHSLRQSEQTVVEFNIKGLQERPGGMCTSAWQDKVTSGYCTYYEDTPQFHKRVTTSTAHGGILKSHYLKAFILP